MRRRKALVTATLATAVIILLSWVWLTRTNWFCISETLSKTSLLGRDFETVHTACDTLAKDESVTVFLLPRHSSLLEKLTALFKSKRVIFMFDPAQDYKVSMNSIGNGRIVFSISEVSSIYGEGQVKEAEGIDFFYQIGKIDYP